MHDEEQLRLLSIFHYVVGGMAAFFALFPIFHLIIGLLFIFAPEIFEGPGEPPPAFIGWIFVFVALAFITVGLVFACLILIAGRFLARRTHYQFCFVVGAIECMFIPFGTVLGVFTIIVLVRESVKQLFAASTSTRR